MEPLLTWLILAFVIEKAVEIIVTIVPLIAQLDSKYPAVKVKMLLALSLSLLIAYGARLDFFAILEIEFGLPFIGILLSGLFMSAGSGFIHELRDGLQKLKKT